MEAAGIGSFSIGNVTGSLLTVGHSNDTVAGAIRRPADPVQHFTDAEWSDMFDWVDDPRDPGYTETPWFYKCWIELKQLLNDHWDRRRGITERDVKIELGNAKEVKTLHVHQAVDLKIFVKDEKDDWIKFHHRLKLPKNARWQEMEYRVSDGVLTIIVPKEVKHAKTHLGNDALDQSVEGGTPGDHYMDID